MLMGIFTISTLAAIHRIIPDKSKAKKFIHATRAALAQCAHSMWKSYRHFIVTANVDFARRRVRKTGRNYYCNRTQQIATPGWRHAQDTLPNHPKTAPNTIRNAHDEQATQPWPFPRVRRSNEPPEPTTW
jgi:hypothetical protein